jgi:hypothetical protein
MRAALNPANDREAAIVGVRDDRTELRNFEIVRDLSKPEFEFEQCMFPTNKLFDDRAWQRGFEDFWIKRGHVEMRDLYDRFYREVVQSFQQYYMPVIELKRDTTREAVCLVFDKVNTGGEKLDAFELLTAIYAASSFDLRADWRGGGEAGEGRAKRMASGIHFPKNALVELQPTDFLQAVSLLYSLERRRAYSGSGEPPAVTAKREDLLRVPLERYRDLAPRIEAGFVAAGKLLFTQHVYGVKDLPYQSQLVPLAVILADLGSRAETQEARNKLIRWWWCGVFGELYGSATETRFSRDVQEVPAWIGGSEEPTTVRDATFRSERLDTMTSRISAAYKGVHVLLMQAGAKDFRSGLQFNHLAYFGESVDIHHVFPRKWCETKKIPRARYDTVVNKTPLFYKSNRIIGGAAPSIYLLRLLKENAIQSVSHQDEILASHGISASALRADDFSVFYDARRESLLRLIEGAMGKAAYRGEAVPPEVAGVASDEEEQEDEILEATDELAA